VSSAPYRALAILIFIAHDNTLPLIKNLNKYVFLTFAIKCKTGDYLNTTLLVKIIFPQKVQ
jgi:hypothetical protein